MADACRLVSTETNFVWSQYVHDASGDFHYDCACVRIGVVAFIVNDRIAPTLEESFPIRGVAVGLDNALI